MEGCPCKAFLYSCRERRCIRPKGKTVLVRQLRASVVEKLRAAGLRPAPSGSLDSAPSSAVSRDKSVRRSAQDDDFVVSWERSFLARELLVTPRRNTEFVAIRVFPVAFPVFPSETARKSSNGGFGDVCILRLWKRVDSRQLLTWPSARPPPSGRPR
jgi:hypothetical protein